MSEEELENIEATFGLQDNNEFIELIPDGE